MIIKGGARKSGRFFAAHLMKTEENERVAVVEMKNLWAEDVPEAFREMKSIAVGTRAENYFYTVSMNPRADEHLTPEQWDIAVDLTEKNLGLSGHSRFQVEHEKEGRTHRHIVWSRVDAGTMTVTPAKNDYYIHMQTSRDLEQLFDHQPTPDPQHGHRAQKEFSDWELFRGQDGLDPKDVKAEVTKFYRQSDSGVAFVAALEDAGYVLCNGQRGYCIVDQAGDSHSLVRRLEGVKTAELRQFMSGVALEALPSVADASAMVRAKQEAEEGGSSDGQRAAAPTEFHNPKLAVLEKYAHDHPPLAPPETYPVAASAEEFADLHRLVPDTSPVFDERAWKVEQERLAALPDPPEQVPDPSLSRWAQHIKDEREQQGELER